MTTFGICMVRNADDIIGYVLDHMTRQVDHIVIADNLSTDGTRDILESFSKHYVTVIDDEDPSYRQSEKTTNLANIAMKLGADYVVPFDADEYWVARGGTLKEVIELSGVDVLEAQILNYIPTAIDNDQEPNPMKRINWRIKNVGQLVKVACAVHPDMLIHMGNHDVSYGEHTPTRNQYNLTVHHYPWRSAEQFVEKAMVGAAALELADLPYSTGQHWRDYAKIAEEQGTSALKDIFREWFFSQNPYLNSDLMYHPAVTDAWK